jgi:hypothetical protein
MPLLLKGAYRMPISATWANDEHSIILVEYTGRWTWDEFNQIGIVEISHMMESVPHTVHLLADMTQSFPLPQGGALSHARNVTGNYPDNWGLLVIVSQNMLVTAMVNVFRTAFKSGSGGKTYNAKTLDEAMQLIANASNSEV